MADFNFDRFTQDILDGLSSAADSVSGAASSAAASVSRQKEFMEIGRDIAQDGAVTSHGGNLSVSDGRQIWVTRTGSRLAHLSPNDVMAVGWQESPADQGASVELKVHRAMYHALAERLADEGSNFAEAAVVHTHSLHTAFHSLLKDSITPVDAEGIYVLGQSVPVLTPDQAIASDEVATCLAQLVSAGGSIAVVRGHGPFAIAPSLELAYRLISCLEYSAAMLTLFDQTGRSKLL